MSLNWDLTKIENSEDLCWKPSKTDIGKVEMSGVTEVLIWGTMIVSLGKITANNYKDFHRRLIEFQVVTGNGMLSATTADGERTNRMPTLQEVKAHIGLSTNVSPKTSRQWTSYIGQIVKETASDRIRKEEEALGYGFEVSENVI